MPVVEYPVVQDLTFQVWDNSTGSWRDLANKATQVRTRRGGQQTGASTAMQTGTLDATLFGALDLANETAIRPNAAIRVVRPGSTARVLWSLIGTGLVNDAVYPRFQDTATGFSTNTSGAYLSVTWNDQASGAATILPNSLLIGSNVTRVDVPNNVKPAGSFDPLTKYVAAAKAIDFSQSALAAPNSRMALVVYTGGAIAPRIIAQGAPRELGPVGTSTPFPPLKFTAPDADWQVGVVAVDGISVTGLSTAAPNAFQAVSFSNLTVATDDTPVAEFTGTILDLSQDVDFQDGIKRVFTSVNAVDSIASLVNTDRYGAVSSTGAGYQSWEDRVAQLSTSALIPVNLPGSSDYTVSTGVDTNWGGTARPGITNGTITGTYPSKSVLNTVYARYASSAAAMTFTPYVAREYRNLTPGAAYSFSATFAVSGTDAAGLVDVAAVSMTGRTDLIKDRSDTFTMPDVGTSITVGLTFTATSAVMRVGFTAVTPVNFASGSGTHNLTVTTTDGSLTRVGDPRGYLLQDTAFQSNLANHFDLACNSVGAYWWADRDNTVIFSRNLPSTSRVTFSDVAGADISYTAVSPRFDTQNVVNSLKMNQHGMDQATGNAEDYSQTFTADSSVRRWGIRSDELETSLYTGPGHELDLQKRASEVMSGLSRPAYQVNALTFNVRSNKAVMDAIDLHRMVTVIYEGRPQRCRVISITENITPTRWTVDLEFSDISAGATYGDFTNAYSGTYADFRTKWAGKTYRDFNANPLA